MSDKDQEFEKRRLEILASLEKAYPGKMRLSIADYSKITGVARGTVYNQRSAGTCPIKFSRSGGSPRALIHDIARYLAEG